VFAIYERENGWAEEKARGLTKFQVLAEHVNRKDDLGRAPLCAAAFMRQAASCKILIESGAKLGEKDKGWMRPLHYACIGGCEDSLKLLLEKTNEPQSINGVDKRMRQGPLHMAAGHGHANLCKVLIDYIEKSKMKAAQIVNFQDKKGRTPLHLAAYNGYDEVVEVLLTREATVNKPDKGGRTALHWAAYRGHQPAVIVLLSAILEKGLSIDAKDNQGYTPIHTAAVSDSFTCLQTLIKGGADVHTRDNLGRTALHLAATTGRIDAVMLLVHLFGLSNNMNAVDNSGQTALHKAAATNDSETEEVFETLLEAGVDHTLADNAGRTALHIACKEGVVETIFLLLQESPDVADCKSMVNLPDVAGNTCLHVAARYGHKMALTLLVQYGAEVNKAGKAGMTALHLAARYGNTDCVRFLVEKSARVDVIDDNGRTPLHAAAYNGSSHTASVLILAGTSAAIVDRFGRTALHYAGSSNDPAVCLVLLDAFSSPISADIRGRTPLHYAAVVDDSSECSKIFVEAGADLAAIDRMQVTPIHLACLNGHKETLEWLLEYLDDDSKVAAAVNALDSVKRSPLHYAAFGGHSLIVSTLLDSDGILADNADASGQTPLFAAAANGCTECLDLLLEAGADGNRMDESGRTAAMIAALRANEDALAKLVQPLGGGSDSESDEDSDGSGADEERPSTSACDPGAVDDRRRTALMMAAAVGSIKCVQIMLDERRSRPLAVDVDGMSAMHIALSSAGRSKDYDHAALNEIVEALVENVEMGHPPEMEDRFGRTAVHLAAMYGLRDPLSMLYGDCSVSVVVWFGDVIELLCPVSSSNVG
jgi:serine/threonine-protein phosphatase 6 regulatory ankyrin repeat subunit A